MDALDDGVSELAMLREFFLRWKAVHRAMFAMRGRELTERDKMQVSTMGQRLVDQAHLIDKHAREHVNG